MRGRGEKERDARLVFEFQAREGGGQARGGVGRGAPGVEWQPREGGGQADDEGSSRSGRTGINSTFDSMVEVVHISHVDCPAAPKQHLALCTTRRDLSLDAQVDVTSIRSCIPHMHKQYHTHAVTPHRCIRHTSQMYTAYATEAQVSRCIPGETRE